MTSFTISSFGTVAVVPPIDVCRLSFYLKCCAVGCGLHSTLDKQLLDYANSQSLPLELQNKIVHLSLYEYNPSALIGHFIFVDDNKKIMPRHVENAFFRLEQVSRHWNSYDGAVRRKFRRVMLCTSRWLSEFFKAPLEEFLNSKRFLSTSNNMAVHNFVDYQAHARNWAGRDHGRRGVHKYSIATCYGCYRCLALSDQYRCKTCPKSRGRTLCNNCYHGGEHDQTHEFERLRPGSSLPESLHVQVQKLTTVDANFCKIAYSQLESAPTAVAIPIEQAEALKKFDIFPGKEQTKG